jgi:hypothetical protein
VPSLAAEFGSRADEVREMKFWSPRMLIKIGYEFTFNVPAPLPMN